MKFKNKPFTDKLIMWASLVSILSINWLRSEICTQRFRLVANVAEHYVNFDKIHPPSKKIKIFILVITDHPKCLFLKITKSRGKFTTYNFLKFDPQVDYWYRTAKREKKKFCMMYELERIYFHKHFRSYTWLKVYFHWGCQFQKGGGGMKVSEPAV